MFGENFQFFGDLSYQSGTGLVNDLDVVIPLAFTEKDQRTRSSLFLQQGVTRWRDSQGDSRDDLRIGVAYRFRLIDKPDSDVVGLSAFLFAQCGLGAPGAGVQGGLRRALGDGVAHVFPARHELASHKSRIRRTRLGRDGTRPESQVDDDDSRQLDRLPLGGRRRLRRMERGRSSRRRLAAPSLAEPLRRSGWNRRRKNLLFLSGKGFRSNRRSDRGRSPAGKAWGCCQRMPCPVSSTSGVRSTKSAGSRSPDESKLPLWRIE